MKTKYIWVGLWSSFCDLHFRDVQWEHHMWLAFISVFDFGSHVDKQVKGNYSYCCYYTDNKCQQSGSQWQHMHSPTPPQNSVWVRSGEQGGQVIGSYLPIDFCGKFLLKSITCLWKCGGALPDWNRVSSGSLVCCYLLHTLLLLGLFFDPKDGDIMLLWNVSR
jgi:hypothetical protein